MGGPFRVLPFFLLPLARLARKKPPFAGAAVPLKVSGMALAALVGVVLNLLLPPRLEPRTLLEEEERLP